MGNTTTETKLIITTDATGAVKGIKMTEDALKNLESSTKSLTSLIKGHWVSMAAAMVGVPLSIGAAWDLAEKAARFEEQTSMLDRLAAHYHTTAASIVSDIQNASRGLISLRQATEGAAHGMMMGLDPAKLQGLAQVAPMLARLSPEIKTAGQMFEDLVSAIGAGRTRALQQIVGVIDLHTKFTNEQVSNMSKVEQASARYEMAMDRIKAKLGDMSGAALGPAEQMELFKVRLDDLTTRIGQAAMPALEALMKHLLNISNFKGDVSGFTVFFNRIAQLALSAEITLDHVAQGFSKFMSIRDRAAAVFHFGDTSKEYKEASKGWQSDADAFGKSADDAQKRIDEINASMLPGGVKLTPGAQARLNGAPGIGGGGEEGTKKLTTTNKYQDALDALAKAQESWKAQVDATAPGLDTLEKKIQAVTDKAKAFRMEMDAKEKKTGFKLPTPWLNPDVAEMTVNLSEQEARKNMGVENQQAFGYSKADIQGAQQMADLALKIQAAQGQDTDALSLANKYLFENRTADADILKVRNEMLIADKNQMPALEGQLAVLNLQKKNRGDQHTIEERLLSITKERAAFEGQINRSIAGINVAERTGEISPAASTAAQLKAHQALLDRYQGEASTAGSSASQDLLNRLANEENQIKELQYKLTTQTGSFGQGAGAGLKQYGQSLGSNYQQGQQFATDAAKGAQDTFKSMFFDGMNGQWKTAADYSKQFLNSLENSLADLASKKLMQSILGFDSSGNFGGAGLLSMLSNLFGGSGGSDSAPTSIDWGLSAGESAAWGYHSGGMGYEPSFVQLPRFHSGIGPGERPAVIRNDEGVFTPGQMRALGLAASGGATNHISTNVGGITVNGQVSTQFSAAMRAGIEAVVTDVVKRHL